MKLLIAITGASGLPLALKFLQALGERGVERHLVLSKHAQTVEKTEQQENIHWENYCEKMYDDTDIAAPVCSGSYPIDGMTIIPCSMNTLAYIAHGIENSLITRAAAVNLKQERTVILVPRETPLSLVHIENMKQAKMAGCSIVPPTMAFYFHPKDMEDMINYIVGKILELLHIPHRLYSSWEGENTQCLDKT